MRRASLVTNDVPDDGVLVLIAETEICLPHQAEHVLGAVRCDEPKILGLLPAAYLYWYKTAVQGLQVENRNSYRCRPRIAIVISQKLPMKASAPVNVAGDYDNGVVSDFSHARVLCCCRADCGVSDCR